MTQKEEDVISTWALESLKYEGDLVEIGLGYGETTIKLLKLAKQYGRKVIGIDPFEGEMPESYRYSYEKFCSAIEGYEDYFILLKEKSNCQKARDIVNRPICFAYVDGLQYADAVLSDIYLVENANIIMVDDFDRDGTISQVPRAVYYYMESTERKLTDLGRWALLTK